MHQAHKLHACNNTLQLRLQGSSDTAPRQEPQGGCQYLLLLWTACMLSSCLPVSSFTSTVLTLCMIPQTLWCQLFAATALYTWASWHAHSCMARVSNNQSIKRLNVLGESWDPTDKKFTPISCRQDLLPTCKVFPKGTTT